MDFLQQHWALITANLRLFISWTVIVAGLTWTVIHFLYKNRLDLYKHRKEEDAAEIQRLRDRLSELKESQGNTKLEEKQGNSAAVRFPTTPSQIPAGNYIYPETGDHGMNILGQTLTDLVVNQTYSMAAKVSTNSVLKVQLTGTPPIWLEEEPRAWVYKSSTRNWQGNIYDPKDLTQIFTAKDGEAELAFIPTRAGKITVAVYEGGRTPAWEKTLKVLESNSR